MGGGERCWEALGGAGRQWEAQEAVEVVGGVGRRWEAVELVEGSGRRLRALGGSGLGGRR